LTLSALSTFLVFVVIPAGAVAVIGGLAFAGGQRDRRNRRYRPGRPYDFQPIWFLAAPEQVIELGRPEHNGRAVERGAKPAIGTVVIEDTSGARVRPGPTGGASDRW
jgi:hypothetical protein